MITSLAVTAALSVIPAPSADVHPYDYAQQISAASQGLAVSWVDQTACGSVAVDGSIAGCYSFAGIEMAVTPSTLEDSAAWEAVNIVLAHEAAHHDIWRTCGTTDPEIAGDRYEAVTTAYAVEIFGANEDLTRSLASESYQWTAEEAEIAHKIHAGQCYTPAPQETQPQPEPKMGVAKPYQMR